MTSVKMMPSVVLFFGVFLVVVNASNQQKAFDGYQLLSMRSESSGDLEMLRHLRRTFIDLDFWTEPAPLQNTTVLVPPTLVATVRQKTADFGMRVSLLSDDVQSLVEAGSARTPDHVVRRKKAASGHVIDHYNYHTYSSIQTYLKALQKAYPKNMEVLIMTNRTYDRRRVYVAKLSGTPSNTSRPSIILEAGMHAREWIAPAVNLFVMEKMLQDYGAGEANAVMMLNRFDWYIIPVANPDGYEYTHREDSTRLWRKNRHWFSPRCIGVDLNRNFDIKFNDGYEETRDCTSSNYHGEKAFSESETMSVRELFNKLHAEMQAYISVHAKGQFLMVPWNYDMGTSKPPNIEELNRVGRIMEKHLVSTHDTAYQYGTAYGLLTYGPSGTSSDWALTRKPGMYVYSYELRPLRYDVKGWLLPANEIVPTGEEFYASMVAMAGNMRQ